MDWKLHVVSFFSSFSAIFAIVDPLAVIPIFLTLTDRQSQTQRRQISAKACLIASMILLSFAITGEGIFRLFGISIPAFQIAGGILLLLLGIAQLSADQRRVKKEEETESLEREDISIFPMATPLLAGPGAISTVVLQASQTKTWIENCLLYAAIPLVFTIAYFMLRSAPHLYRLLGQTGLNLVTRIMGIILTAIAVQYIIDGLTKVWTNLQISP